MKDQQYLGLRKPEMHSLLSWATSFLKDLRSARKKDDQNYVTYGFGANFRLMSMDANFCKLHYDDVITSYKTSRTTRVFFLDNEGTLAPDMRHLYSRANTNKAAYGGGGGAGGAQCFGGGGGGGTSSTLNNSVEDLNSRGTPPRESVLQCLRELAGDPKNIVVVISGRSRTQMSDWFDSVKNIGLAAEHGWCFKIPQVTGEDWYCQGGGSTSAGSGGNEDPDSSTMDYAQKRLIH